MLSAVRERNGAIVILEDLDHLSSSNATTREFLLNCLDGLLEIKVPILWIATSNNPALLEENLLNRPGRFDRVIVFPLPGPEEREAMIRRYSKLQIDKVALSSAVSQSGGLTGAHLREAATSAMLESLDSGEAYGPTLIHAIQVLKGQHASARNLQRGLNEAQVTGFRTD